MASRMVYLFGILLLIGSYLAITTAQDQCVCTREKKDVCGSDGRTYNNLCLLKCAQANNSSLTFRGQGTCKEITSNCFCGYDNSPLCASDGRNYSSQCEFKCQQAVNPKLSIRNKGKCRKSRQTSGQSSNTSTQTCACGRDYKPVCGSDGVTYDNECLFNCAFQSNKKLKIKFRGACQ